MDKNDYYGGESTSLNLIQLWKLFRGDNQPPEPLGSSREYNVDMIPKFMMANRTLVRVLIHANVTKYLNFKAVDGSFVYNKGNIHKVPATDVEALKSPLMGLFEKRRAHKFFVFVQEFEESVPKTHHGMNLDTTTARELIAKYELEDDTIDFIGHALALHFTDSYLDEPALDVVKRMKVYAESLARFEAGSPYLYPMYGLGELPQENPPEKMSDKQILEKVLGRQSVRLVGWGRDPVTPGDTCTNDGAVRPSYNQLHNELNLYKSLFEVVEGELQMMREVMIEKGIIPPSFLRVPSDNFSSPSRDGTSIYNRSQNSSGDLNDHDSDFDDIC